MIKLYSPNDELELSIIRGLFDTEGIHYYVHNDYFGSLRVGPQIDLLNKKTIMVATEDADRAREIVANVLECAHSKNEENEHFSTLQKLRMICEAVAFGWFIPGKKRRRGPPDA